MKNNKNIQFLCKDCTNYNRCQYYYGRMGSSYICKYFNASKVFDKIIDEIEQESFHDANGVIYVSFNRVCKIIEKYKGGADDGNEKR